MVHRREFFANWKIHSSPHRGNIVWSSHGTQRQAPDADGPPRPNGQKLARSPRSAIRRSRGFFRAIAPGLGQRLPAGEGRGCLARLSRRRLAGCRSAQPADHLSPEERRVLDLAQNIGCSQVMQILENIRFLGYEVAMSRLVDAKPIIEVDKEVGRPSDADLHARPACRRPRVPSRSNSATPSNAA